MFLDIGAGILLAILTTELFNLPLTTAFLVGGIVFALLMDINYIFHLGKGGSSKNIHKHRDLLHHPLLYIPLGISLISFFNFTWAILFGLCSFVHFMHDSIGIGWGVQWLYPFSKKYYVFFYHYRPSHVGGASFELIQSWKHEDIDDLAEKYGDPDWIKNIYLSLHPYSIVEFSTFIIALVVLYFYIK